MAMTKAEKVSTYGWYYEDGAVKDVCQREYMWQALGRAVEDAVADDRLPQLRFGIEVPLRVSGLLDEDDIQSMIDGDWLKPWGFEDVVELVGERAGDVVEGGTAHLRDKAAAKRAFDRADTPSEVLAWAVEHIELDPDTYYSGRYPLPIEYVEGEWRFGCSDPEPTEHAAVITYAIEPSAETGHVGWCWWALGKMGESPTLPDAMAACMVHIRAASDGGDK